MSSMMSTLEDVQLAQNKLGEFGTPKDYLFSNTSLPQPKGAYEIYPSLLMTIENKAFARDFEDDPYNHINNFIMFFGEVSYVHR
jgi:hypothetical protein